MIVFGIDPGTTQSAYVEFDSASKQILSHGKVDNFDILLLLQERFTVVCEMVQSFGMPVGSEIFQTVLWVGRFCECCRWVCCDFTTIHRGEIKDSLCHSRKANDAAIRQRLIDLLGPPGTKKDPGVTYGITNDRWQALAVVIAYLIRNENHLAPLVNGADGQSLPFLQDAPQT